MDCARTVAVVVPSPATSLVLLATSLTMCAPMFSKGFSSSISLATVTPSLVMVGAPNFLSRTTFRPRGPNVTFTASASLSTPLRIAVRASALNINCFDISGLLFQTYFGPRLSSHLQHDSYFQALIGKHLVGFFSTLMHGVLGQIYARPYALAREK